MLCIYSHTHMAKRNIIWHSNTKPSSKQSNQLPTNKPIYELSSRVCFVFVSNLTVKTTHTPERTHISKQSFSHILFVVCLRWDQSKVTKHVKQTIRCVVPSLSYFHRRNAFLILPYSQCHRHPISHSHYTPVRYLFRQKATPNCNLFGNYLNCRHLAASTI